MRTEQKSLNHETDISDTESQNTALSIIAFWRHELYSPINIINGYCSLILEDLEDLEDLENHEKLHEIQQESENLLTLRSISKQIQNSIGDILSSQKLESLGENIDLEEIRKDIRKIIEPKVKALISLINQLLKFPTEIIIPDLNKIQRAIHLLASLASGNLPYPKSNESKSDNTAHNVGQTSESVQEKSNFVDLEESLRTIKSETTKRTLCLKKPNILIVDNNRLNCELLSRQLGSKSYHTTITHSGHSALQLVQENKYDLILLDIIMPGMSGYEVLEYLHSSEWRDIPVIMISSLDNIDSIAKCIENGAEDYLPKPFNPTLLSARVEACLEKKYLRDQEKIYLDKLARANQEIQELNRQLEVENIRLSAELEITRILQKMILPRESELKEIQELDIAGFMEPADEVGGDYYDVFQHNGDIRVGIGDVTGHGLESGVLMIMVQTAVRALSENNEKCFSKFLNSLNRTIYNNVQRMESTRNLTLSLISYRDGKLTFSGQHEEVIVIRASGDTERIDTVDLGFPIGLEENIEDFVNQTCLQLNPNDTVVLYTDGITEAENRAGIQYGIERLCKVVKEHNCCSADEIKEKVIDDLKQHISDCKIMDDITLLVLKQK
jgi:sigma-B regulation protein RsbU (phosphoserine phosphatase)